LKLSVRNSHMISGENLRPDYIYNSGLGTTAVRLHVLLVITDSRTIAINVGDGLRPSPKQGALFVQKQGTL
jgi:hypothetical protein